MPSTVNGIGTTYRNERNYFYRQGKCGRCGADGSLTCYDTEKWFVIFFIPIWKISSLHIVNYCQRCTTHQAIPLEQWAAQRVETVGSLLTQYRQNPQDGAVAVKLLDATEFFEDSETYTTAFEEIKTSLKDNPDVLAYLGRHALQAGDARQGKEVYNRIIEIDPFNFHAHAIRMLLAIDDHDVETAEKHAKVITSNGAAKEARHLIAMIQFLQTIGKHHEALAMLGCIEFMDPDIGHEKDFLRLRKVSQENEASGKAVRQTDFEFGRAERERKRRNRIIAITVVVAGLATMYALYCGMLGHRERLWFVNGTDRPYTVKLDGKDVVIPTSRISLPVGLGRHVIEPSKDSPSFPRAEFTMEKVFFTRPFSKTVFVSNPDALGVVVSIRYFYSSTGGKPPAFDAERGAVFMAVDHVDCPFEDPPETVSVSSGQTESRIGLASGPLELLFRIGPTKMGRKPRLELAKARLASENDKHWTISTVASTYPTTDVIELLKEGFPGKFGSSSEAHAYYGCLAIDGKMESAVNALDEAIATRPAEAGLLRDRGIVEPDAAKSLEFLKSAAMAPDATDEMRGEYASALFRQGHLDEGIGVISLLADVPPSASLDYYRALVERGEFEKLESVIAGHEAGFRGDFQAMLEASLADPGKHIDLKKFVEKYPEESGISEYAQAYQLYAEGKSGEAAAAFAKTHWGQMEGALISGDLKEAERNRNGLNGGIGEDDLLLYLAGKKMKGEGLASRERGLALSHLRQMLHGGPALATMIEQKTLADPAKAVALDLSRTQKAMGLLMLSIEHPETRETLEPIISDLASGRMFPSPLIRLYLGK